MHYPYLRKKLCLGYLLVVELYAALACQRCFCATELTVHTSVQIIWVIFRGVWLRKQKIFVHACTKLNMHSLLFITVLYRHWSVSRRITACFKPYQTIYISVGNVWLLWVFPTWRDVPQMAFQTIFLSLKRELSIYDEFCMKKNGVKILRCSQTVPVPSHFELWNLEDSVLCWAQTPVGWGRIFRE